MESFRYFVKAMRTPNLMFHILQGMRMGFRSVLPHIWKSYILAGLGVVFMLLPLYGVQVVINLTPVSMPSSVVCMLILFLGLLLLEAILGTKKVSPVLKVLDIPLGFTLRWMGLFFTVSFILLPLASRVTVAEAFEIAAVFFLGYVITVGVIAYMTIGLQKLLGTRRKPITLEEEIQEEEEAYEMTELATTLLPVSTSSAIDGDQQKKDHHLVSENNMGNGILLESLPLTPVSSNEGDHGNASNGSSNGLSPTNSSTRSSGSFGSETRAGIHFTALNMEPPKKVASISRPNNPGISLPDNDYSMTSRELPYQTSAEPELPSQIVATFIATKFDWIFYSVLWVIGIIVYYTTDYAMPLHLAMIVLLFKAAMLIPAKYRKFIHPIIVSSAFMIFGVYLTATIRHQTLFEELDNFKTGRNYLKLFGNNWNGQLPGGGDVLSTLLDVSIVALALPMYNYRSDLKRNFLEIAIPSIFAAFASFTVYPPLCYAIGISKERSMAFMARSVTLALALPITATVGGSSSLVAVVAILSGIMGVFFGPFLMGKRCFRVRKDDYITKGVTMGINSSAIASANYLTTDPRAAALSSLSFFLFGTMMIILAAITPLTNIVRSWVDLGHISS